MRLVCREERDRRIQTSTRMATTANAGPATVQMRTLETGYWTPAMGGSGLESGGRLPDVGGWKLGAGFASGGALGDATGAGSGLSKGTLGEGEVSALAAARLFVGAEPSLAASGGGGAARARLATVAGGSWAARVAGAPASGPAFAGAGAGAELETGDGSDGAGV